MKMRNLFIAATAAMMFFTACSSEDMPEVLSGEEAIQEFVLQVANLGDGLQSRAGRPLLSDAAGQKVSNVRLIFVKDGKIAKLHNEAWEGATDYTYGKEKSYKLPKNERLANGTYTVYAIGYDNSDSNPSNYDLSPITGLTIDNDFDADGIVLSYASGKTTPDEIFAGSAVFTVDETKKLTVNIVLNRQVAGAYVYGYNLPMVEGMTTNWKLQLVAGNSLNNKLVLGRFANTDIESNGTNTGENVKSVANGYNDSFTETVICSTTISEWYSKIEDTDADGIVDNTNWISTEDANKTTNKRKGGGYAKGSLFASGYIIPFKKFDSANTLKLQIVDESGAEKMFWTVKSNATYNTLLWYNSASTAQSKWVDLTTGYTENASQYSILRNHLYSVGKKLTDGISKDPDNPGEDKPEPDKPDPDDPDPNDPDLNEPEDLSKSQTVTLKINQNWEVIHRMELE